MHASADLVVAGDSLTVRFSQRAHNAVLESAGIADGPVSLPWLGNLPLRVEVGPPDRLPKAGQIVPWREGPHRLYGSSSGAAERRPRFHSA